ANEVAPVERTFSTHVLTSNSRRDQSPSLCATLVSDSNDEIFLLYTRLADLKPADSSDAGHLHSLGSENSNQDVLLVCIELKPPTTCEPQRTAEIVDQRRKRRMGGGAQNAKDECKGRDPIVLE
ncbi:hypothetical protein EDB85DRAFT_1180055, partial [Lactarius pseudohatsudake]